MLQLPCRIVLIVALVLLALPLNLGRAFEPQAAGSGNWSPQGEFDAIDGDYHRID